jgi:hypothetical protein
MKKHYVIVSLNHSDKDGIAFWRANNSGYTTNPWQAGIYSEDEVNADPDYYNDGFNTVAVCINNSSVPYSGINIQLNKNEAKKYRKENLGTITPSKKEPSAQGAQSLQV